MNRRQPLHEQEQLHTEAAIIQAMLNGVEPPLSVPSHPVGKRHTTSQKPREERIFTPPNIVGSMTKSMPSSSTTKDSTEKRSNLSVLLEGESGGTKTAGGVEQEVQLKSEDERGNTGPEDRNQVDQRQPQAVQMFSTYDDDTQNANFGKEERQATLQSQTLRRPPNAFPSSAPQVDTIRIRINASSSRNDLRDKKSDSYKFVPLTRSISSKEFRPLAPPIGSPYAYMLHQRNVLEESLQRKLIQSRNNRSQLSSQAKATARESESDTREGARDEQSTPSSSSSQLHRYISHRSSSGELNNNKSRNRRRAEHTRAMVQDLCEIVTDLFLAEYKLLNHSNYGVEPNPEQGDNNNQREQILDQVHGFVSSLPPRYALDIDTPSKVLLHMRLMASARLDPTRAVVHISLVESDTEQEQDHRKSKHLVTVASHDAEGLLEYMTKLLGTGGSRVIDADVMMSTDNVVLNRFMVQMNGRLRLDKLSKSIEAFLSKKQPRTLDGASDDNGPMHDGVSGLLSLQSSSSLTSQGEPTGPLYFQPLPSNLDNPTLSPQQMRAEIDNAVPLSELLAATASSSHWSQPSLGGSAEGSIDGPQPSLLLQSSDSPVTESGESTTEDDKASDEGHSATAEPAIGQRMVPCEQSDLQTDGEDPRRDTVEVLAPTAGSLHGFFAGRIPLIPFQELRLIENLDTGRASTIYRAVWHKKGPASRSDEIVALKVATTNPPSQDTSGIDELQQEADIAAMLQHPRICELVGVAADIDCFCLAYRYYEGGSLYSLLSDKRRYYDYLPIALDVANGMAYLHSRNIIHRDLKPSNVLLCRDMRAVIADFGMSVANTGQELTAETGTYRYMAPEVIRHESYSSNADVYSFGILLWQLVTREIPFARLTPIQAAFSVAQGTRPEIPDGTPPRLKEIIVACWDQDSHKRPSFTYIAMALADYARMAFTPANVGAQTLRIANEMLANVEGNSTINVDFSTPVTTDWSRAIQNNPDAELSGSTIGLEIM